MYKYWNIVDGIANIWPSICILTLEVKVSNGVSKFASWSIFLYIMDVLKLVGGWGSKFTMRCTSPSSSIGTINPLSGLANDLGGLVRESSVSSKITSLLSYVI